MPSNQRNRQCLTVTDSDQHCPTVMDSIRPLRHQQTPAAWRTEGAPGETEPLPALYGLRSHSRSGRQSRNARPQANFLGRLALPI